MFIYTTCCDGMWKSGAPNATGITVGNDSEFLSMINLLEKKQYSELLTKCTANIKSTPEWLTGISTEGGRRGWQNSRPEVLGTTTIDWEGTLAMASALR